MRKTIAFLLVLLLDLGLCQVSLSAQSFTWDSYFEDYKITRALPGECLWEYGMTDTSLLQFKGLENGVQADYSDWARIYQHWYASVLDSVFRPAAYEYVSALFYHYFKQGVIAMPVMMVKGKRLKRQLFLDGTIFIDSISGRLSSKSGETIAEEAQVFVSAPFVQRVFDPNLKLFFSDSFFYTNCPLTLKEVQLKLNGGVYTNVKLNQLTLLPLSIGDNQLVVKYVLDNNETYYSQTTIRFNADEASFGNADIRDFNIGDERRNIYTTPYRQTETGEPLGAYVEVVPGLNNGIPNSCIKKPVIFVEGIDFGYEDHATGCYGGKCGSMGLRDLLRGRIFHPYESKEKNAYEDWVPIVKAPQLIAELRNNGYDLIYLDFHNGADYMENNAMLLVELIKRINFIKCDPEEIVVIGASMGGQITRFALSYMEKMQIPHCVRNFVAFDSPNQGANIPLGLQHFLKFYKGKLPKIKDQFNRKIDRAASRELLLGHCLSMDGGGEHADRVSFTSALSQLGSYPVLCRKIALLNGSINATDLGHEAGEELLEMNPFLGKLNFDILEVSATVWSTYATIEDKHIVMEAQYPFHSKQVVEVPKEAFQNDFIPGSLRFDVSEYKVIAGVFNILNRKDVTCFIPSYSALDLYNHDPVFDIEQRLNPNIPNPLYTPFDAFFGVKGQGQEHMMITDENIHWLLQQIEENRDDKPKVLRANYNMGRFANNRIGELILSGSTILSVNGKGRNGFGNGRFDQANRPGSHYPAKTAYCQTLITIADSAQLVLGSPATDGGNTAELHIARGATLNLKKGSTLLVNDGSVLIIEEGAKMQFEKGAKIILDGDNARLFIDGELVVGEAAVFSILPGASKRSGYVRFRNLGGGYGAAKITALGDSAGFILNGKGKAFDMVMQLEGHVTFSMQNPFRLFKVNDARIAYGSNSSLLVNGNAVFDHVEFDVLSWARKSSSTALFLKQFSKAEVRNCDFKYFDVAIETFDVKAAELQIDACNFSHGNQGLVLNHANTNLLRTVIRSQTIEGVVMLQNARYLSVSASQLIQNGKGIRVQNPEVFPTHLFVDNCHFSSNGDAIQAENTIATLACTRFILNQSALNFDKGLIGLSPKHTETVRNASMSGGNCTIVESSGSGIIADRTLLYLEDGGNNFIYEGKSDTTGLIRGNVLYSEGTNSKVSPYHLLGSGNYWSPLPKKDLADTSNGIYDIRSDFAHAMNQRNAIAGARLKVPNSLCYTGGNCPECEGYRGGVKRTGVVGVNQVMEVFPLPANEVLTIVFRTPDENRHLVLRSIDGKVFYHGNAGETSLVIDISALASGMYWLEVYGEGETECISVLIHQME